MKKRNEKEPRKQNTDWGFWWAGIKGILLGILLGKTIQLILVVTGIVPTP